MDNGWRLEEEEDELLMETFWTAAKTLRSSASVSRSKSELGVVDAAFLFLPRMAGIDLEDDEEEEEEDEDVEEVDVSALFSSTLEK